MKVLITGGARRIGKMLTLLLASKGHEIAIHYNHSTQSAEELLKLIGGESKGHTSIQANLSDLAQAEELQSKLKENWGSPDILINNASTYHLRGMSDFSKEEMLEDYNMNFFAPVLLMKELYKLSKQGLIINILDRRVNYTDQQAGPYGLAKKSLRDATLACSDAWKPNIRVNAIAPCHVLAPGIDYEESQKTSLLEKICTQTLDYIESDKNGNIRTIEQ